MLLIDLIKLADAGYRRGFCDDDGKNCISSLLDFVDAEGIPLSPPPSGDTLALFLVRELSETFEGSHTDQEQIDEAYSVIARSRDDLENVLGAIGSFAESERSEP